MSTGQTAADPAGEATTGRRAPHERIIEVAREMFCRDGIHATGIDRILAEAGASKMTLYARFGSKELLVREVLQQEGTDWRAAFIGTLRAASEDPAQRLANTINALRGWFNGGRFYGCAFMNAVAEHTKGEAWLRALAADHHRQIVAFLAEQAEAAGYDQPAMLARQLLLLIDGTIAALMVSGDETVLDIAERTLSALLLRPAG